MAEVPGSGFESGYALDIDRNEAAWSIVLKGFAMGSADVVPGVSGGTVAFLVGIYARLVDAIRAVDVTLLRRLASGELAAAARHVDLAFIAALGTGIVLALATFTRLIPLPYLLNTHPEVIYAIFFGLILGSSAILLVRAPAHGFGGWCALAAGFAAALPLLTSVPDATPDSWWFLMVSGALALSAMILPGVSGSFVLLMLGKYATVLDAVGRLELGVLVPFLAGGAVGLLSFARALSYLIHRFEKAMTHAIIGVLLASLWVIWPFQHRRFETIHGKEKLVATTPYWPEEVASIAAALGLAALAAMIVIALERIATLRARSAGGVV